jgi:hypothetical protein
MSKQTLPVTEAAQILQTTPLNILMHIKRGLLKGHEKDGQWQVQKASLDALLRKTGGKKADDICTSGCAQKHACSGGCS